MSVRFVLGRSGSGKTRHCIDGVIAALRDSSEKGPLLLLVPEQATFQAERSILTYSGLAGFSRLGVLSFDRLRFLLTGSPSGVREISCLGREMAVYRILHANRDKLSIFARAADTTGLARHLARVIIELHQSAKQPDDLRHLLDEFAARPAAGQTDRKFADIAMVFEHYSRWLAEREEILIDPDRQMIGLQQRIGVSDRIRGGRLWVDGFAGFTPQEQSLLIELIRTCRHTEIALCLDPTAIDLDNVDPMQLNPVSLFAATERTYCEVLDEIRRAKAPVESPILLSRIRRFSTASPLAWIERCLFEQDDPVAPKTAMVQAPETIRLIAALTMRTETETIAREIHRLVRLGRFRYRDIAVVASDLSGYQPYLRAAFADAAIPCFIDRPDPVHHHPVVELIQTALTVVLDGFVTVDIFAWLKTPLSPLDGDSVSRLENYCLAFGIDRRDWMSDADWTYCESELNQKSERGLSRWDVTQINTIRRKAVGPLLALRRNLGLADSEQPLSAGDFVQAVWTLLDELDIPGKLDLLGRGDPDQARIHRQLFEKLVDLFDEFSDIFSGETQPANEWFFILQSVLGQLTLKQIPPMLDQVLVGSIERSRHPDLRAVFLIGATQRQFPVPIEDDPILTDDDRLAASQRKCILSDRLGRQLSARPYLAYIAFTRPSERLYITWPLADGEGKQQYPSRFVQMLAERLNLRIEEAGSADFDRTCLSGPAELEDHLCDPFSRGGTDIRQSSWLRLVERLESGPESPVSRIASRLRSAIHYTNTAMLDPVLVRRRWPNDLPVSASKLESYGTCPYQFFARYLLELRPREILRIEPVDLGTLYHRILEQLFHRLRNERLDFATAPDGHQRKRLQEVFEREIETDPAVAGLIRHSRQNAWRIRSALGYLSDAVATLARICRAGEFRPIAAEASFGPGPDQQRIELAASDGTPIVLCGSIDRVDSVRGGNKNIAILFDYKRKRRSISWTLLNEGIDLQLAVYLVALRHMKPDNIMIDEVAGAFYLPIEPPLPKSVFVSESDSSAEEDKPEKAQTKANGIFNGQYARLLDRDASKWSQCYNYYVSGRDVFGHYPTSGAIHPEPFATLSAFARDSILRLSECILSGRIDIVPYRYNRTMPCTQCEYRSLCKFDWRINDPRILAPLNKVQFLTRIGGADDA